MEENFYDKIFYKFQIKHLNLMKIINMKTMNRLMNLINADINNHNHLIFFKKKKNLIEYITNSINILIQRNGSPLLLLFF
jgi:hypothetical protein